MKKLGGGSNCAGYNMEFVTYQIRWVILAAICATSVSRMYMAVSFELANGFLVDYLRVTAYQIDILATADAFVAVFVSLLMAFIGQRIGIKVQSILASGCMSIGAATVTFAISQRNFYWCLVLGRLIAGIPAGLLYILPATFANTWFPPNEIATAFSLPLVGFSAGSMLSAIVFPALLPNINSETRENVTVENSRETLNQVRSVYMLNMSIVTCVMIISTMILIAYTKNRPPTPPSRAQELLIEEPGGRCSSIKDASTTQVIKYLLQSQPFCLLTLANTLSNSSLALAIILSPSLVHATIPTLGSKSIGLMFVSVTAFGALGSMTAGWALDKFGHYKDFAVWGTLGTAIISTALYVGHIFASQAALFVLYPLLSFFRAFTVTADIEFLIEATYPSNAITLTSLHFAFYNLGLFIFTIIERLIMNSFGEANAVLVSAVANLLSFFSILFVNAEYRRSKANILARSCDLTTPDDDEKLDHSFEERDKLL